jgi:hypothetical protein
MIILPSFQRNDLCKLQHKAFRWNAIPINYLILPTKCSAGTSFRHCWCFHQQQDLSEPVTKKPPVINTCMIKQCGRIMIIFRQCTQVPFLQFAIVGVFTNGEYLRWQGI